MSVEIWVALIGLLTTVIGAVRWMLSVSHKNKMKQAREKADQEVRVENLKERNAQLFSSSIESKLKLLESLLEGFKTELHALKKSMDQANVGYEKFNAFIKSMDNFILDKEKRMKHVESEIIRISNDVIMIKGKKNGSGT